MFIKDMKDLPDKTEQLSKVGEELHGRPVEVVYNTLTREVYIDLDSLEDKQ